MPNLTPGLYRFDDLPWCYGCNPADFGISIKNRIAFVFRGRCDYFTKIKNTFPYEPDAIIIINNKQYHGIPSQTRRDQARPGATTKDGARPDIKETRRIRDEEQREHDDERRRFTQILLSNEWRF